MKRSSVIWLLIGCTFVGGTFLSLYLGWNEVEEHSPAFAVPVVGEMLQRPALPQLPMRSLRIDYADVVRTSSVVAKPVEQLQSKPMTLLSSASTHSVGSGLAVPMAAVAPVAGRTMLTQAPLAQAVHRPMAKGMSPSLGYASVADYITSPVVLPVKHRAPGTIGGDGQGDATGESVWSQWLNEYNNSGYTDLEAWWNDTYGNGYTPDIFTDFQQWATPMPDALLLLLFMASLYVLARKKRLNKEQKK